MALMTASEAKKIATENYRLGADEQLITLENIIGQSARKGFEACFWNGDLLEGARKALIENGYVVEGAGKGPSGIDLLKISWPGDKPLIKA